MAPLLGTAILRSLPVTGSELRGVGSRLAGFHTQWESLLGTCRATMVLQTGVVLQFISSPPLTRVPVSFGTRDSAHALQAAVDTLIAKGAVHRVRMRHSLGFYSRLFLVPKTTGELRPVIDLSTLNLHLVIPHFRMETAGSVRSAIQRYEWTTSIDIQDAYLHIPMAAAASRYLRFQVNRQVYQFGCLPFGLATSPREFTKMLRPVVHLLRLQGIKVHVYLDDWLVRAD